MIKSKFSATGSVLLLAVKTTIPVLMGYLAIGIAFGVMITSAGYSWITAPFMSIVMYAGSGQMLAVSFFTDNTALPEIIIATTLLHLRHCFYGLSLLKQFSTFGIKRFYMIFALTDETYALLTGLNVPENINRENYFFLISLLNHSYWIIGGLIGAGIGALLPDDLKGIDFALTALFIVLAIEQFGKIRRIFPFAVGAGTSIFALVVTGKSNMLLLSIIMSFIILIFYNPSIINPDNQNDDN